MFKHSVDQTNGIDYNDPNTLVYPFTIAVAAKTQTCNLGHIHIIERTRYNIPEVK